MCHKYGKVSVKPAVIKVYVNEGELFAFIATFERNDLNSNISVLIALCSFCIMQSLV